MNKFYAALPWGEYHRLECAMGQVSRSPARSDNLDEVIGPVSRELAEIAAETFTRLCSAAWTPNQTPDEQVSSGEIMAEAGAILEAIRSRAAGKPQTKQEAADLEVGRRWVADVEKTRRMVRQYMDETRGKDALGRVHH